MSARTDQLIKYLEQAGAHRIRHNGTNIFSSCPFHSKDDANAMGSHNSLPFTMHAEKGAFCCWSSRCGECGSLAWFLRSALGWSKDRAEDAASMFDDCNFVELGESAGVAPVAWEDRRKSKLLPAMTKRELAPLLEWVPQYMLDRGFSKRVLEEWEVGYDHDIDKVVFVVRDRHGRAVGITHRSTDPDAVHMKYVHGRFSRGEVLYGENRLGRYDGAIVVVEGQPDALTLAQVNHALPLPLRNAAPVATFGTLVTGWQKRRIAQYQTVFLMFDNDQAGLAAQASVAEYLSEHATNPRGVFLCQLPDGIKDPGMFLEGGRPEDIRIEMLGGVSMSKIGQHHKKSTASRRSAWYL